MHSMNHSMDVISLGRRVLSAATLAVMLLLTAAPSATADDRDCQRRTAQADRKLHQAIEHHGYNSRQADHWRHELRVAREHCWRDHNRWWDVEGSRWHRDHDWNDHDHDHK
jgi:hypothetical protein